MNTRQALLDAASELVRARGYAGFSYADLAERVGIRKASIHHHFATKDDLGLALVEQYTETFAEALLGIRDRIPGARACLDAYADLYRESLRQELGCLCGMMASDISLVSAKVAAGIRRFMDLNRDWLEAVIVEGQRDRQVTPLLRPREAALSVLTSCQGSLLVARSCHDPNTFDQAIGSLLDTLCTA